MMNPIINPQPNYSGVTIQISNPAVYAVPGGAGVNGGVNSGVIGGYGTGANYSANAAYGMYGEVGDSMLNGSNGAYGVQGYNCGNPGSCYGTQGVTNPMYAQGGQLPGGVNPNSAPNAQSPQQAYPPQYYLNNYNYQNNGIDGKENFEKFLNDAAKANGAQNSPQGVTDNTPGGGNSAIDGSETANGAGVAETAGIAGDAGNADSANGNEAADDSSKTGDYSGLNKYSSDVSDEPQDMSKSQAVIEELDARAAAEEEAKKNSKQKRVVALTDEYIKSLENYLNNPNDEIRLMAAKEILTRLDEDKDRFNDAALNALLNKMLQDPSKLIRVAALSAFASQLASGNDYTVTLLHNIQQNPSADKEDVLQAADILLKMSAGTEIKDIPNPEVKENTQE